MLPQNKIIHVIIGLFILSYIGVMYIIAHFISKYW